MQKAVCAALALAICLAAAVDTTAGLFARRRRCIAACRAGVRRCVPVLTAGPLCPPSHVGFDSLADPCVPAPVNGTLLNNDLLPGCHAGLAKGPALNEHAMPLSADPSPSLAEEGVAGEAVVGGPGAKEAQEVDASAPKLATPTTPESAPADPIVTPRPPHPSRGESAALPRGAADPSDVHSSSRAEVDRYLSSPPNRGNAAQGGGLDASADGAVDGARGDRSSPLDGPAAEPPLPRREAEQEEPPAPPDESPLPPPSEPPSGKDLFGGASAERILREPGGIASSTSRLWRDMREKHSWSARLHSVDVRGVRLTSTGGQTAFVAWRELCTDDLRFLQRQVAAKLAVLKRQQKGRGPAFFASHEE